MAKTALVFSGYNQRAVIALCRFFTQAGQDFAIVSAGPDDPIHLTDYKTQVIFDRPDKALTIGLFEKISPLSGPGVYCPTSEFLNVFVLEHSDALAALGIDCGMPDGAVYALLTGKKSSQQVLKSVAGVEIPRQTTATNAVVPCILKPYRNVSGGATLYPVICETAEDLARTLSTLSTDDYFAQDYVSGQSYYFCGYVSKAGDLRSYWQENLLQQPGGKSIVLARTCPNPGLDEGELSDVLIATGYHGPIMVEFIKDGDVFNYIETNPRFWGPLQLGLDCGDLLSPYLADRFGKAKAPETSGKYRSGIYYSWAFGAGRGSLKTYPAAEGLGGLEDMIEKFDVFNRADTMALHNTR